MKSRRGIATIVATVFLVAIVAASLTYITYSLEIMANFSEQLVTEETRKKDVQDEAFELSFVNVTDAAIPLDFKLDATIKNTGEIPLKITTLWLDKQNSNDAVLKIPLDVTIAPGRSFNFLDESIDVDIDDDAGYSMKFITSRGETQTSYLNSAASQSLDIRLIAIPESIPTGFDTTLLMTVVNNMTNNNVLINLTPADPYPDCSSDSDCTLISGPDPASYDMLDSGEIAIFKWTYELSGLDTATFSFTGSVQNGVPGNSDSEIVTIDTPEFAENSGVTLESLGFGQTSGITDLFLFHTGTYGIPSGVDNYQLSPLVPDTAGLTSTFTGVSDSLTFWSANVSATDAHFPAGNWNASLRYYHDALPSEVSLNDIGLKLHFEDTSPSTGLYDSGNDSRCYNFVETGSESSVSAGLQWYSDRGVNGSGAYYFDGIDDRIRVEIDTDDGKNCTNFHHSDYSVSGWFNATRDDDVHTEQWIYSMWDDIPDGGGFAIKLGDGTSDNHGRLYFKALGDDGVETVCAGDEPDGDGGTNYMDGQWHHFVGTAGNSECNLYIDGVWKVSTAAVDEVGHWDAGDGEDIYIGADENNNYDFTGYIDDIMFWVHEELSQSQVTALKEFSFGNNATKMDFLIGNYTDDGVLVGSAIKDDQDYPLKWGDPGHYAADSDDGLYRGGNYTALMNEVRLNLIPDNNRLGFTMTFASGEPLYLQLDDSALDGQGSNLLSSYLQPTILVEPQVLPVFYVWDNDDLDVKFFAFSSGNEGAWFTDQGTRIIFNGTGGNYAGLIDTVSNGVDTPVILSDSLDSPYIAKNTPGDFVFHAPQSAPTKTPVADVVTAGSYEVTIFLSGYDDNGTVFVRSINIGSIMVVE